MGRWTGRMSNPYLSICPGVPLRSIAVLYLYVFRSTQVRSWLVTGDTIFPRKKGRMFEWLYLSCIYADPVVIAPEIRKISTFGNNDWLHKLGTKTFDVLLGILRYARSSNSASFQSIGESKGLPFLNPFFVDCCNLSPHLDPCAERKEGSHITDSNVQEAKVLEIEIMTGFLGAILGCVVDLDDIWHTCQH